MQDAPLPTPLLFSNLEEIMRYKIVIKSRDKTFARDRSKNKEYLLAKVETISKKHPKWKVYVVSEDTMI